MRQLKCCIRNETDVDSLASLGDLDAASIFFFVSKREQGPQDAGTGSNFPISDLSATTSMESLACEWLA